MYSSKLPDHAVQATGFAERMIKHYATNEQSAADIFAAFAGLVSIVDKEIAADCLIALDERLSRGASTKGVSPTA